MVKLSESNAVYLRLQNEPQITKEIVHIRIGHKQGLIGLKYMADDPGRQGHANFRRTQCHLGPQFLGLGIV